MTKRKKYTKEELAERKKKREIKLNQIVKEKEKWNKKHNNRNTIDTFFGVSNDEYLKNRAKVTFFTNQQILPPLSNFCICIVKNYKKSYSKDYKEVMVDPGVHDLGKYGEYRYKNKIIKMLEEKIPKNIWTSLDYSTGLVEDLATKKKFVKWTYENNIKYADNSQYICAIQTATTSFKSFLKNWNKVKGIFYDREDKMVAVGGQIMVTHNPNRYTNNLFNFLSKEAEHLHRIHFYGLSIGLMSDIKKLLKHKHLHITIDSTKWRFANTKELLELNGGLRITLGDNITDFYSSYMKQWEKRLNCRFEH